MLGALAARGLIAPLPEKRLRADGDQWGGIFALLQLHEAAWGNQIMAVPLGSPVLTCYYRADLLESLGAAAANVGRVSGIWPNGWPRGSRRPAVRGMGPSSRWARAGPA